MSKETGEPLPYKKAGQKGKKDIREIRGIYLLWKRSPKYVLRMESTKELRMYVSPEGKLTTERKAAKVFSKGFDDPEAKQKFWAQKLGVKFVAENL